MKRNLTILMVCCGLVLGGAVGVLAKDNPKLASEVSEARKAGIPKSTLSIFLSQVDGAQFSVGITKAILRDAIETQKAGAPGGHLLLKASEGVAKSIAHLKIAAAVHKLGEELQQIAKSLPANLSDSARRKAVEVKYREAHPARPTTKH